jgi:hypothetical protein
MKMGWFVLKVVKKNHFFLHLQKNESIFLEGVNYLKEKPFFPNLEMIEAESKPAHVSKRRTESRYFKEVIPLLLVSIFASVNNLDKESILKSLRNLKNNFTYAIFEGFFLKYKSVIKEIVGSETKTY